MAENFIAFLAQDSGIDASALPADALAVKIAQTIHNGVKYGGGMDMLAQVVGTNAQLLSSYSSDSAIMAASFLHKVGEEKRFNDATKAFVEERRRMEPGYTIAGDLGRNLSILAPALNIVAEIQQFDRKIDDVEKSQGKDAAQLWQKDNIGALSLNARIIIIAEKSANLETSLRNPNPDKPAEWHRNYAETRYAVAVAASAGVKEELMNTIRSNYRALLEKLGNSNNGKSAEKKPPSNAALPPKTLLFPGNYRD